MFDASYLAIGLWALLAIGLIVAAFFWHPHLFFRTVFVGSESDQSDGSTYADHDLRPFPKWTQPAGTVLDRLTPAVQHWYSTELARKPEADIGKILEPQQAKQFLTMHNAIATHGKLIEQAILEAVKEKPNLVAVSEPNFHISHGAAALHGANTNAGLDKASHIDLNYGDGEDKGTHHHRAQVDLITWDKENKKVTAYEIKRGADVATPSSNNLRMVKMLLKSYALKRGAKADTAEAYSICYYGCSDPKHDTFCCADLDQHFGCEVRAKVDGVTKFFRQHVQAALGGVIITPAPKTPQSSGMKPGMQTPILDVETPQESQVSTA